MKKKIFSSFVFLLCTIFMPLSLLFGEVIPGLNEFQSIPTNGAYDGEFFTINNDSYLAVANMFDGSTYNIDSKIYKWNGTNFVEFQTILTNAALDWEFFTIGSAYYLAVANYSNDSTFKIDSNIQMVSMYRKF